MERIRTPARTAPRPHPRDGLAAIAVATLVVLETLALRLTPVGDWPLATVALGAALAAVAVTSFVLCHHPRRPYRRPEPPLAGGTLFDAATRDSFPLDALRPCLPAPDEATLNRLRTAWVLALRGRDAAWLAGHLNLSAEVAGILADAAAARHRGTRP
ncbi:hypothetical protein [Streptomyces sp. I05A-00742]|uniref:hypothetical protein n=1 Tax=Streptomyces sp. I05A-00742 TaxID=2732853 RepID=UPI0014881D3C|nr:hypothetical protein [Streptomyces sp. I05A-00742]